MTNKKYTAEEHQNHEYYEMDCERCKYELRTGTLICPKCAYNEEIKQIDKAVKTA